jgi:predicted O-methyltransferase YrrM
MTADRRPGQRSELIEGWMRPSEIEWLTETACTMPIGARVVEIGSWKGKSTVAICKGLADRNARMWAVDTFEGDAGTDQFIGQVPPGEVLDAFRANTREFAFLELVIARSTEAATRFDDASLDWIFIDADHSYEAVVADIRAWTRKLKPGGLMSGHDFGQRGVMDAVYHSFQTPSYDGNIWHTRDRPRNGLAVMLRALWRSTLARTS